MDERFCYDCGEPLAGLGKESINKEHIPAKCLARGFEKKLTHDLITIKAKKSCNSSYSHLDDELRNFVAFYIDGKGNQSMLEKAFRSIVKKEESRFQLKESGLSIKFDPEIIDLLNEKTFKGLFYHTYKKPLPIDRFRIYNLTEEDERINLKEISRFLYVNYIKPIVKWEISGHEDLFRYKIVMLKQEKRNFTITEDIDEMKITICAMHYYKTAFSCSMAFHEKWVEANLNLRK